MLSIPHDSALLTICFRRLSQDGDLGQKDNARKLLDDVMRPPLVQRGKLVADPDAILARPIRDYRDFVDAIFRCYADAQGKPRWGAKTPFYTPDIDIISRVFPDAKIVHLVRDRKSTRMNSSH